MDVAHCADSYTSRLVTFQMVSTSVLLAVAHRSRSGSDPGAFMQARSGLYGWGDVSADGQVRWFLVFKGNDLHAGTAPTVDSDAKAAFLSGLTDLYMEVGEVNRIVYVAYPNAPICRREVQSIAISPVVTFGTEGGDMSKNRKAFAHTFDTEGSPALGTPDDVRNRLVREKYMQDYNTARMWGLTLPLFPTSLDRTLKFLPMPFDPERDAVMVDKMRGLYSNLHRNSLAYRIKITKIEFTAAQDACAEAALLYSTSNREVATAMGPSSSPSASCKSSASAISREVAVVAAVPPTVAYHGGRASRVGGEWHDSVSAQCDEGSNGVLTRVSLSLVSTLLSRCSSSIVEFSQIVSEESPVLTLLSPPTLMMFGHTWKVLVASAKIMLMMNQNMTSPL